MIFHQIYPSKLLNGKRNGPSGLDKQGIKDFKKVFEPCLGSNIKATKLIIHIDMNKTNFLHESDKSIDCFANFISMTCNILFMTCIF